jgi:hypothetical protein
LFEADEEKILFIMEDWVELGFGLDLIWIWMWLVIVKSCFEFWDWYSQALLMGMSIRFL